MKCVDENSYKNIKCCFNMKNKLQKVMIIKQLQKDD